MTALGSGETRQTPDAPRIYPRSHSMSAQLVVPDIVDGSSHAEEDDDDDEEEDVGATPEVNGACTQISGRPNQSLI